MYSHKLISYSIHTNVLLKKKSYLKNVFLPFFIVSIINTKTERLNPLLREFGHSISFCSLLSLLCKGSQFLTIYVLKAVSGRGSEDGVCLNPSVLHTSFKPTEQHKLPKRHFWNHWQCFVNPQTGRLPSPGGAKRQSLPSLRLNSCGCVSNLRITSCILDNYNVVSKEHGMRVTGFPLINTA